ncbi:hypothetical protein CHGG_03100 [Chaetomium globosum CBS 148.51]|uniref:Metallo-beta-lactamase domain-containing protein n=1 Tax=Chaetomium globosum (strain ATCC 6205 / CBS 148.51 / DSM 1962 / NBRC 6347 / NRRL 1970) TaxID=306901 RepID=Q2H9K4_CHAGB|nr:uncharacterized protein CHGG_03100 [Chaetomium globosum CBS 148.51]EAQ91165.1 hypothetical protein CHGG_03100 [Chaetomium globosum CBS 148.51]
MPPPTFATPLPQSPRSDILEWRFPKPYHNLTLTGRSRAAWHTSFVIPQLNLLLDAGMVVNNLRPKHIFLTHGHSDHTLLTPAFVKRSDPPDIYCPAEMKDALDNFINAKTMLSEGGGIWPPESTSPYLKKYKLDNTSNTSETKTKEEVEPADNQQNPAREQDQEQEQAQDESQNQPPNPDPPSISTPNPPPQPPSSPPHPLSKRTPSTGLHPSSTITLPAPSRPSNPTRPTGLPLRAHTVPCLGYLFSSRHPQAQARVVRGLSGAQLKALRQQQQQQQGGNEDDEGAVKGRGVVELTAPVATPACLRCPGGYHGGYARGGAGVVRRGAGGDHRV